MKKIFFLRSEAESALAKLKSEGMREYNTRMDSSEHPEESEIFSNCVGQWSGEVPAISLEDSEGNLIAKFGWWLEGPWEMRGTIKDAKELYEGCAAMELFVYEDGRKISEARYIQGSFRGIPDDIPCDYWVLDEEEYEGMFPEDAADFGEYYGSKDAKLLVVALLKIIDLNNMTQYSEMHEDSVQKRVKEMLTLRDEISPVDVKERHIKLSYDNRKTTALVPSVSLIPVADCGNCELCARGCYDVRHVCMYKQTKAQRANNSALLKYDRPRYFEEIAMHAHFLRFFRWHVGGDIKDMDYLERMVKVAKEVPGCEFLVFTKMFRIVERYLKENGEFPENFHLILSGWKGDKTTNPYRLPVSTPVWPNGEKSGKATEKEIWCGGNCADCAACHGGCWGAQKGDTVLFKAH